MRSYSAFYGFGWDGDFYDDFSVEGTLIPEPGTLGLSLLGGMLLFRRRR